MPTAIELMETRQESWTAGRITATRRFAVWDDSSPLTSAAAVRSLFGTNVSGVDLPDVDFQFPGDSDLYVKSYALKPSPSSRYQWEVEFTYENSEPNQRQPEEIGYTAFNVDWTAEFREVWRTNPGLSLPQYGSPGSDDIVSGQPIDIAGEPMTVLEYQSNLQFIETVAIGTLSARSIAIRLARGKRNLTDFQGAGIGEVLYRGASANRIGIDRVQLTHSFVQDSKLHMIQRPDKDMDGRAMLMQDSRGLWRAKTVRWVQPFPEFANFNLLSENF